MRTNDIIKTGINRNFLRECEVRHLIEPNRIDSDWIVNKDYTPREYSQEDVEIVWNAYLCRKMGLSYDQIKALNRGEEISIRESLNNIINKYEKQIEELEVLIEFMKYVKGVGFVPSPPKELMGSANFKSYLIDFINYLDKDKRLKKTLDMVEYMSEIDDFDKINNIDIDTLEDVANELTPHIKNDDREEQAKLYMLLKDKIHLKPYSEETQNIIHKLYDYQKKIACNPNLSPLEFARGYIFLFSHDSDMTVMFKNLLGEETCKYYVDALIEFIRIQEPDRLK